jgi:hypothetical protein
MQAARPDTISKLASHYVCLTCASLGLKLSVPIDFVIQALVEEQLSDNREWLFDTELPSLADISVHFLLAWVATFRGVESLYDETQIPRTLKVNAVMSILTLQFYVCVTQFSGSRECQLFSRIRRDIRLFQS